MTDTFTPQAPAITVDEIKAIHQRIQGIAVRTPLLYSHALSRQTGAQVYLKPESLQPTGAFKTRGAANLLQQLTDEQRRTGVVTASSGNYAQAVAFAARELGIQAVVVIPETSPEIKAEACRAYGAEVVRHGRIWEDAWAKAQALQTELRLALIHPFDDVRLIQGQATCALEILEDLPDADAILAPIGGGSLIAGLAIGVKAIRPETKVVGVQASGSNSAVLSWRERRMVTLKEAHTIAEGIKTLAPGVNTLAAMLAGVDEMVEIEDDDLIQALFFTIQKARLTAELSGVPAIAALLSGRYQAPGKNVVAVISGGNLSMDTLRALLNRE